MSAQPDEIDDVIGHVELLAEGTSEQLGEVAAETAQSRESVAHLREEMGRIADVLTEIDELKVSVWVLLVVTLNCR